MTRNVISLLQFSMGRDEEYEDTQKDYFCKENIFEQLSQCKSTVRESNS